MATVVAIVGYDHWSSIKPELSGMTSVAIAQPVPRTAVAQARVPAPQSKPVARSSDSSILPPAPIPVSAPASAALAAVQPPAGALKETFGLCGQGAHFNCVLDGSTFWVRGAKIRIADIDAPGAAAAPRCEEELRRANAAKVRLLALLNAGPFTVQGLPDGAERDGAKLKRVMRNSQSLGDMLVSEGLARRSSNGVASWCA